MHNAYCDADENSLDLRIHPKQHTTCASVRGKRSKSYNYGYVVWHSYIYTITTWDNKLRGLLKRTCPLLTDVSTRCALYLSLVKSQLCYATQVWSPAQVSLKAQVEWVQRRATRWILQTRIGEMSYRDRLITLDLLPLIYDREVKDLVFFYKCFFNHIHLDVCSFTNFISHGCTRLSSSFNLKTPICETSTFRPPTSIALWNFRITLVLLLLPLVFRLRSPSSFSSNKRFLTARERPLTLTGPARRH